MSKAANRPICHKVHITHHAMLRLRERVGSYAGYRSRNELASIARYKGRNETQMSDNEYNRYTENMHNLNPSAHVRLFDGFAYIFMGNGGKAHTLITVIRVTM